MSFTNSEYKRLSWSNMNFKFTLENPSSFEFWDVALWQFILLPTFYGYNENFRYRNEKIEMPTNIHWNFTENYWKIMVSRSAFRLKCMFLHSCLTFSEYRHFDYLSCFSHLLCTYFSINISLFVRINIQWKDSKNLFNNEII